MFGKGSLSMFYYNTVESGYQVHIVIYLGTVGHIK